MRTRIGLRRGRILLAAATVFSTTAICLGAVPATAQATHRNAHGTAAIRISGSPSASTPYCAVVLTKHSMSAERCAATKAAMESMVPDTSTVIGIDYVNADYQGASLTWYEPGVVHCSGFPDYEAPSMPNGWNDVISSYKDYANCSNNPHYENTHYRGASVNCGPDCRYVGSAMNDRTSSEKWGS